MLNLNHDTALAQVHQRQRNNRAMPIIGLVLKEQGGLHAYERRNIEGDGIGGSILTAENKTREVDNDLNSWHNMNEEGISGVFKALTEKADKCE